MSIDMRKYQKKPLDLVLTGAGGRDYTYRVAPPPSDRGMVLTAVMAVANLAAFSAGTPCPTCLQIRDFEVPEDMENIIADHKGVPVKVLALGQDIVDDMDRDGIPGVDQDMAAIYATFVWERGQAAADTFLETVYGDGVVSGDPKGPKL